MKYEVTVREIHSYKVVVEAESEEEALKETEKKIGEEDVAYPKLERVLEPTLWIIEEMKEKK